LFDVVDSATWFADRPEIAVLIATLMLAVDMMAIP